MRKLVSLIMLFAMLFVYTSCTSTVSAQTYGSDYYGVDNDVVVVGDTCYVYYKEPTTVFLNSLHIIDGAYYYWYHTRYIPVIFPNWFVWSPYRYFYYENNHWCWRDRHHYNHDYYRRTHYWIDYRHHNHPHHNHGVNPPLRPHNPYGHNDGVHRPTVPQHRPDGTPHHRPGTGHPGYSNPPQYRPNGTSSPRVQTPQRQGGGQRSFGTQPRTHSGGGRR